MNEFMKDAVGFARRSTASKLGWTRKRARRQAKFEARSRASKLGWERKRARQEASE